MSVFLISFVFFSLVSSLGLGDPLSSSMGQRDKRASDQLLKNVTKRLFVNEQNLPGLPDKDGNRCVTKQVTVKETVYVREKQCKHVVRNKCHLTYITDYHPRPEEKCETNYVKDCHIVFTPTPHTEKVKKCHVPFLRDCSAGTVGPEVCSKVSEDFCETRFENYTVQQDMPNCTLTETKRCEDKPVELFNLPNPETRPAFAFKEICEIWPIQTCEVVSETVLKVHPKTACKKVQKDVCMPSNCKMKQGPKICVDKVETTVQNIPEEQCDLHPQEHCKTVTSLVPRLVPKKNCVKVPKEICINVKAKPKEIPRNVPKIWCYNPLELLQRVNSTIGTD